MHVFFYWRLFEIKHYGKLIIEKNMLSDEKIRHISLGVINKKDVGIVYSVIHKRNVIFTNTFQHY